MKKLFICLLFFPVLAFGQRQDLGVRGGGAGGAITGAYNFAVSQFAVNNVTNVAIGPSARFTNAVAVTGLNLEYGTASTPLILNGAKDLVSSLLDITSASQFTVPLNNQAFTTNTFSSVYAASTLQSLTNIINGLPFLSATKRLVIIMPGNYDLTSPTLNFFKSNLVCYAYPGVRFSGTNNIFFDMGAPGNVEFYGEADFHLTNAFMLANILATGADLKLFARSVRRYGSFQAAGILEKDRGNLFAKFSQSIQSDPYDIYIDYSADTTDPNASVYIEAPYMSWGGSLVEITGSYASNDKCQFHFKHAKKLANDSAVVDNTFFGDACLFSGETIDLQTNTFFQGYGTANPPTTIFNVRTIKCDPASKQPLFSSSGISARFINTEFTGPTAIDPILMAAGNVAVFDNCRINVGSSATNAIRSVGAVTITGQGNSWNKPIHSTVTYKGSISSTNGFALSEQAVARPLTNTVGLFAIDLGFNRSLFGWIDDAANTNIMSFSSPSAGQSMVYRNGVWTNETVSGTGDVTAAANFATDNVVIRSDGTAKGVQLSGVSLDDANNCWGLLNFTNSFLVTTNQITYGWAETRGSTTNIGTSRLGGLVTASNGINSLLWMLNAGALTNSDIIVGSNGISSTGTNNGAIRLSGTNTGFQEFTVFSDGASNSLVLSLSAAAKAGEPLSIVTNITQAGTNQIIITNATYSVSTNELVMNQYYTNTARRSFIGVSVQLSAAAAGTAKVSLRVEYTGVITNVISVSSGPLASLVTVEPLSMLVGPFCRYYITNETSGSGASVSVVNGTSSAIGL
jgi:hypothetical protein